MINTHLFKGLLLVVFSYKRTLIVVLSNFLFLFGGV